MNMLKRNIVANLLGRGWGAVMSLAFVPVYIKFIGIESYGLIGIFIMMQALFGLLDLGLSVTVNREMARLSTDFRNLKMMRNLLRTMEFVYWVVAVIIILTVIVVDPFISQHWVKPKELSANTIYQAIFLMGFAIAAQWPGSLYSGGLLGLQKQALLSLVNAVFSTIKAIGAILVLWFLAPTIRAFFIWQVIICLLQTLVVGSLLWRQLRGTESAPRFDKGIFQQLWRFAAGMSGISVMSVIVTQTDKIVLSNMLSLKNFGYYTLAATLASGVYYLIGPVFSAFFPNFSRLVKQERTEDLRNLYHKGTQLLVALLFPIMIFISLSSSDVLLAWTHNHAIVNNAWLVLCLLIIGNTMNGLMNIPYAVQLAYGRVKIPFYTNLVGMIFLVPTVFYGASRFGGVGAASAWVVFNFIYVLITVWMMDKLFFKEGMRTWYVNDVGIPLCTIILSVLMIRQIFLLTGLNSDAVISLVLILLIAYISAVFSLSSIRILVKNVVRRA